MSIISFTCQAPYRCQVKCDTQSQSVKRTVEQPVTQRLFYFVKLKRVSMQVLQLLSRFEAFFIMLCLILHSCSRYT